MTGGTSTTYAITVNNLGPSTVPAGVVVKDTIPAGTTASESEADCALAAGVLTCTTTAALAPGGSVSYELTLAVSAGYSGASLANTATIDSSPVSDPTPGNNSDTDTNTVTKSANLSISKSDGVSSVTAGTSTTYAITVSNSGALDGSRRCRCQGHDPGRHDGVWGEAEADCAIAAGVC